MSDRTVNCLAQHLFFTLRPKMMAETFNLELSTPHKAKPSAKSHLSTKITKISTKALSAKSFRFLYRATRLQQVNATTDRPSWTSTISAKMLTSLNHTNMSRISTPTSCVNRNYLELPNNPISIHSLMPSTSL